MEYLFQHLDDGSKKLLPKFRTLGNHRRYDLAEILNLANGTKTELPRKSICYARLSGHDQKSDLIRQKECLEKYCTDKKIEYDVISDLGSGMNYKKRGLKKLILLLISGQVKSLILTHKDRLLRFGSELIFSLCNIFGTEVIIIHEEQQQTFEEEMVSNFIEIVTVFSARLYGKRSHQNKKKIA